MSPPQNVLFVLCGGSSLPSTVIRGLQFRPFAENDPGWKGRFMYQKSERADRYVASANTLNPRCLRPAAVSLLERLRRRWEDRREEQILELARGMDVVYLTKFPSRRLCERLRSLAGPKVVVDVNDGLWLPQYNMPDFFPTLALADAVVCENHFQAGVLGTRHPNVFVVPDAPRLEMYDLERPSVQKEPGRVRLGWIGGDDTAATLHRLLEPLDALAEKHPSLELRVLGAAAHRLPRFECLRVSTLPRYDQKILVREALGFDIGLFPLYHTLESRARGTLKAKIYMCAGAVAACENFGENPDLIQDGRNGLLACSHREWSDRLEPAIADANMRATLAAAGLATLREHFTTAGIWTTLCSVFTRVAAGRT